jgi:hypothetical protein
MKEYYIGFYKFQDAKTWHQTRLNDDKRELEDYLYNLEYVDKSMIFIKTVELPE